MSLECQAISLAMRVNLYEVYKKIVYHYFKMKAVHFSSVVQLTVAYIVVRFCYDTSLNMLLTVCGLPGRFFPSPRQITL